LHQNLLLDSDRHHVQAFCLSSGNTHYSEGKKSRSTLFLCLRSRGEPNHADTDRYSGRHSGKPSIEHTSSIHFHLLDSICWCGDLLRVIGEHGLAYARDPAVLINRLKAHGHALKLVSVGGIAVIPTRPDIEMQVRRGRIARGS